MTYADTRLTAGARRCVTRSMLNSSEVVACSCEGERNRRWRDFTRNELRDAVSEVCVHASAYRSYVRSGVGPQSRPDFVDAAVQRHAPSARSGPDLLDLLPVTLLVGLPGRRVDGLLASNS